MKNLFTAAAVLICLTTLLAPVGRANATCNNVCQTVGFYWICDLGRTSDSYSADIWVVYDPSGSDLCGDDYCAEGTDGSNTAFDCQVSAGSLVRVSVIGTGVGDAIDLYHGEYDLNAHTTEDFLGLVSGGDGDDVIYGSRSTNNTYYTDSLHGDADQDVIYGQAGDDTISGDGDVDTLDGGTGDDTISGNGGNDTIDGGAGSDILSGNAGNDTIDGGAGGDYINGHDGADTIRGEEGDDEILGGADGDFISGGDNDDQLRGGNGPDTICGDSNTGGIGDALYGGLAADLLFGNDSDDSKDGGDGVTGDLCDCYGTNSNCTVQACSWTRPGGCPAP